MNLILFDKEKQRPDNTFSIIGEKADHIKKILKLKKGDFLKSGIKNGLLGKSKIISISDKEIIVKPLLDTKPPTPLDLILILALPRPKVARRLIYTATCLGIKKIYLIHSKRVEKSYWQSPYIGENEINRQIILGLEQSIDTIFPQVIKKRGFKPFTKDELPQILEQNRGYLLHPYSKEEMPKNPPNLPSAIIVGPEGGYIPYETQALINAGAHGFNMGQRILRVETSVVMAASRFV